MIVNHSSLVIFILGSLTVSSAWQPPPLELSMKPAWKWWQSWDLYLSLIPQMHSIANCLYWKLFLSNSSRFAAALMLYVYLYLVSIDPLKILIVWLIQVCWILYLSGSSIILLSNDLISSESSCFNLCFLQWLFDIFCKTLCYVSDRSTKTRDKEKLFLTKINWKLMTKFND